MIKSVLVCQNRTCLKHGAAAVLAAFQERRCAFFTPLTSGCLGQCGNGPMVRVLPDEVWYWRVRPEEVPEIVERHLIAGTPVNVMRLPGTESVKTDT